MKNNQRAHAERAIRARGPFAAIIIAPSEDAAVARAALALGQHWNGEPKLLPSNVHAALATWRMLNVDPK